MRQASTGAAKGSYTPAAAAAMAVSRLVEGTSVGVGFRAVRRKQPGGGGGVKNRKGGPPELSQVWSVVLRFRDSRSGG
eukprot:7084044-Pyramimonas_sp.AAC.1